MTRPADGEQRLGPPPADTYPVFTEAPAKTYQLAAIVRGRTPAVGRGPEQTVPSVPHLFYAELGVMMVTLFVCIALSMISDAPLKELANPSVPENPAKAPWYFLGLQEMVSFSAFAGGIAIPAIVLMVGIGAGFLSDIVRSLVRGRTLSDGMIPGATAAGLCLTGRMYQQFALTIAISVLLSAFNALSLSPALAAMLLRPAKKGRRGPLAWFFGKFNQGFDKATSGYVGIARHLVRRAWITIVIVGGVVAAVAFLGGKLPAGFIPEEDQGIFGVNVQLPAAASLERTSQVLAKVEEILARTEGVDSFTTIGGFGVVTSTYQPNFGTIFARLHPWEERKDPALKLPAIMARLQAELAWKGHLGPCPVKGKGWSSCNSSPIALRLGGIDVAVCQFYRCAAAVRADNGERFWMELNNAPGLPKGTSRGMAQATANEGFLFVFGTRMLQVGDDGSLKEMWEGKIRVAEYNISYSHTIIKDGRLIAFTPAGAVNPTGPGMLRMLDARTGEELASLACAAKGALAWADGLIYLLDNRPGMVLIEATKDSLREVSSFKPPFGKYGTSAYFQLFTPPVVAEGRLFLRDQSRVLVYDLRKDRYP